MAEHTDVDPDQEENSHPGRKENCPGEDSAGRRDAPMAEGSVIIRGEYTWWEFMWEFGHGDEIGTVYDVDPLEPWTSPMASSATRQPPETEDWGRVEFDPARYLGATPDGFLDRLERAAETAETVAGAFDRHDGEEATTTDSPSQPFDIADKRTLEANGRKLIASVPSKHGDRGTDGESSGRHASTAEERE